MKFYSRSGFALRYRDVHLLQGSKWGVVRRSHSRYVGRRVGEHAPAVGASDLRLATGVANGFDAYLHTVGEVEYTCT